MRYLLALDEHRNILGWSLPPAGALMHEYAKRLFDLHETAVRILVVDAHGETWTRKDIE